jgi:hypothetical protein
MSALPRVSFVVVECVLGRKECNHHRELNRRSNAFSYFDQPQSSMDLTKSYSSRPRSESGGAVEQWSDAFTSLGRVMLNHWLPGMVIMRGRGGDSTLRA